MKRQAGQALLEFVMLLIGFTALLLGIIFTAGLELSNNQLLLDARLNANLRSTSGAPSELGPEYFSWNYMKFEDSEIPFSGQDRPIRSANTSVAANAYELQALERSQADNYYYRYSNELMREHGVNSYRDLTNNAYELANLVRGSDPEFSREVVYLLRDDPHKAALYRALHDWCGVRVDQNTLKDNPSNQVFMPQNIKP